jgi:hypothetical protein
VGIPQSSIVNDILPKYEDEIDDMDDEQETQIAIKAKKTSDKVVIKREINKKLYFLMAALFASITTMEIIFQIYNFVQQPNELVVYQTMKHLVCLLFSINTSPSSLYFTKPSTRLNGALRICLTPIVNTFATLSRSPVPAWGLRLIT